MKKQLLHQVRRIIQEFKQLCSDPDVLKGDIGTLKAFSFSDLCATLELKAPVLMGVFQSCIQKKSLKRHIVPVVCTAVLMKTHQCSTILQKYISLILYSGNAGKQASQQNIVLPICMLFRG